MSDMYTGLASDALDLITELGQAVTLRHTDGFYDAATGLTLAYSLSALGLTVDATAETITRASGSWLADGVKAGDVITFAGFVAAGNNAALTVTTAAALVLTFAGSTGLADETAAGITATSPERTTDTAAVAVEDFVNSVSIYAQELVPGSLITEADRFFLVSSTVAPAANDKLIVGGTALTIMGVRPLSPAGIAVYYSVRARG